MIPFLRRWLISSRNLVAHHRCFNWYVESRSPGSRTATKTIIPSGWSELIGRQGSSTVGSPHGIWYAFSTKIHEFNVGRKGIQFYEKGEKKRKKEKKKEKTCILNGREMIYIDIYIYTHKHIYIYISRVRIFVYRVEGKIRVTNEETNLCAWEYIIDIIWVTWKIGRWRREKKKGFVCAREERRGWTQAEVEVLYATAAGLRFPCLFLFRCISRSAGKIE